MMFRAPQQLGLRPSAGKLLGESPAKRQRDAFIKFVPTAPLTENKAAILKWTCSKLHWSNMKMINKHLKDRDTAVAVAAHRSCGRGALIIAADAFSAHLSPQVFQLYCKRWCVLINYPCCT